MISDFVLKNKRSPNQEYTLHLFEKCNLACKFCWQDHSALKGVAEVRNKVPQLIAMLDKDERFEFTINIMGGEIFADDLFDENLQSDYFYLCDEVDRFTRKNNKKVVFNFVSNLVNNRQSQIRALFADLKKNNIAYNLVTSYDPRGRFSHSNFELFKSNVEFFSDEISCISMLITKPLISLMLNSGDRYFEYLYEKNFYIYFDYYSPADDYQLMMPNDDDLVVFFKYLVDNFPKVNPIREWIENSYNTMSCRSSKLLLGDGTECKCGNLILQNKSVSPLFDVVIESNDNSAVEMNFMEKYNCLECKYFNRCTLGCFVKHSFTKRASTADCPFKATFAYIDRSTVVNN
tara:strand:+ start:46857 stop:47897 length:1041 start_codon:yes stop_codon:yes gene_type:complete